MRVPDFTDPPIRVVGEGPGVVLIAGGASTCFGYFPHVESSLAGHARVATIDPPGIGRQRDTRELRLGEVASGVAEALEPLALGPCLVVAHSLGALVALRLALDFGHHVGGLLLLDPSPFVPSSCRKPLATTLSVMRWAGPLAGIAWRKLVEKELQALRFDPETETARAVYMSRRFTQEMGRWAYAFPADAEALATDLEAFRLSVGAVVVSADGHTSSSPMRRAHEELVRLLPGAELQKWDGVSHALHIQQPQRVVALARRLLAPRGDPPEG